VLTGYRVVEFDPLREARAIGDLQGRTTNVVALGVLSTVPPFSLLPTALWQRALLNVSPGELVQRANLAAFQQGVRCAAAPAAPRST
jgi:indolepyruvate ferredoxin oxidoreductase alpha subunit